MISKFPILALIISFVNVNADERDNDPKYFKILDYHEAIVSSWDCPLSRQAVSRIKIHITSRKWFPQNSKPTEPYRFSQVLDSVDHHMPIP